MSHDTWKNTEVDAESVDSERTKCGAVAMVCSFDSYKITPHESCGVFSGHLANWHSDKINDQLTDTIRIRISDIIIPI